MSVFSLRSFLTALVVAWLAASQAWTVAGAGTRWIGSLAVGQNADGRLELFRINGKGEVLHRWQKMPNGEWSSWANLGGTLTNGFAVTTNASGRLMLFGVDRTSATLQTSEQTGVGEREWSNWTDLGGHLSAPIALDNDARGAIRVYAVNAQTASAVCLAQNGETGAWSTWQSLGGSLQPGLVLAHNRDGASELFGVDAHGGNLVHCWQTGQPSLTGWSGWDSLGGHIQPGFAVGRNLDGRLEVFAIQAGEATMQHLCQTITTNGICWSAWSDFGEHLETGAAVGQNADGRLEIFALDDLHADVMHRWQFHANGSDDWSPWWSLWGSVLPPPVVGRNQDGNLELFAVDATNRAVIQHKRQISANSDWLDWFSMDQPVFPYTSRTWQTEDGLPHNVVHALAQTTDGYLWVGTDKGLGRFDGLAFTLFDVRNTPALKSSTILSLCVDRDGTLWIGTDRGLAELKDGRFQNGDPGTLSNDAIHVILAARDGSLWIGATNGLYRYQQGKLAVYTRHQGLLSEDIRTAFEDAQSNIWIGTDAGLNRLSGTTMDAFCRTNGLPDDSIRGITQDKGWRIWIGSDNGMIWYNTGQFYAYGRMYGLSDRFVNAVHEDRDGNLWVGTHSGLNRFREGRFFNELKSDGTPYDEVNTLFEDREGNIWVGSNEGLIRLTPRRFFTYNKQEGLTHNNTVSVLEDDNDTIWTATYGGGLNSLQNGQAISYTRTNGLTTDLILSLATGHDGSLWIGAAAGDGLYQLKDGKFKHYTSADGLAGAVRVIHEGRAGALWLGTDQGLACLKEGRFHIDTVKDGLAGNLVRDICEDHSGQLWLGTDGGLSRRTGNGFVNYTVQTGLPDNSVTVVYEDPEHNLWIGTENGGLARFALGRFRTYTREQGLFSDEIFEILDDDHGWLWMSCSKGVFRVRKGDLDALDEGKTAVITSIAYGISDGMAGTLCNGVAKPAGWKARDGRLWFVTTKGLVVVDPRIQLNDTPPPVFIEQVFADGRPTRPTADSRGSPVWIPPGQGDLEFHYSALNFQHPEAIRFKYRLTGADADWIDAGTRRLAHYNNVFPGNYNFQVTACNSDGIWSPVGATMAIAVRPHLWQIWWVRTLAGLLVLAAVGGLARYVTQARMRRRLSQLEQQNAIERERGRIAKDMHDELGSNLTRILMLGQRILDDANRPAELEVHAQKIVTSARATVQSLDEIVWAVNPENDTLDELVGYLNQYASQFFDGTQIRYRLEIDRRLSPRMFPAEIRHNLFLLLKEALNNALKHSRATEVRVGIHESADALEITVADNGRGFAAADGPRKGNGLANMRKRMAEISGEMHLHSVPQQGTQLQFIVKLVSAK